MDYLWSTFIRLVHQQQPTDVESLWQAVQYGQDHMSQPAIDSTIENMSHICQEVIDRDGYVHAH